MTPGELQEATGCARAEAGRFARPLTAAMERWEIDSPKRQAAFLGQVAHESRLFTCLLEDLDYRPEALVAIWPARFRFPHFTELSGTRTYDALEISVAKFADGRLNALEYAHKPQQLANVVYANRMGNGDEASGDGWRFRGRGLAMLTGRANYAAFGSSLGTHVEGVTSPSVVASPDLLLEPGWAADSAGYFWTRSGAAHFADIGDIASVTQRWNGGQVGLAQRIALTTRALAALA